MMSDAVTVPVRMEAMMRRISDQWARIRACAAERNRKAA